MDDTNNQLKTLYENANENVQAYLYGDQVREINVGAIEADREAHHHDPGFHLQLQAVIVDEPDVDERADAEDDRQGKAAEIEDRDRARSTQASLDQLLEDARVLQHLGKIQLVDKLLERAGILDAYRLLLGAFQRGTAPLAQFFAAVGDRFQAAGQLVVVERPPPRDPPKMPKFRPPLDPPRPPPDPLIS